MQQEPFKYTDTTFKAVPDPFEYKIIVFAHHKTGEKTVALWPNKFKTPDKMLYAFKFKRVKA